MDYEKLREEYPETITMEQFYRIAHISKRKANWLLTNGVVPCEDSGKQTRRFKIRLDNVIDYLQKVQGGTLNVSIPSGIFASGATSKPPREYLDCDELKEQFLADWYATPDMLTIKQASKISGYVGTSILRWVNQKQVKGVLYHERYLISKESLAEFLSSKQGQDIVQKSEIHRDVIVEYMSEQKNSGMEFTMSL
ncbi:DNA-binding protein [Oscillibacter sp. GMB15532]|uniref:DNA-binding protein n=1 Tax=Oscillibacter sp. GMB15532 TaxID=3230022 RepID=UPI0034DF28AA